MIGFLVVNLIGTSVQPKNASVKQRYRQLRKDKPWFSPATALQVARHQVERVVRHRLLDIFAVHNGAYSGVYWIAGRAVSVEFRHDENHFRHDDDNYKIYDTTDYVPQYVRKRRWNKLHRLGTGRQVELVEWSEQDAYEYYLKAKYGKAEARRRAIESRQEQIKRIEQILRGDISAYFAEIVCEGIDMDDFSGGCSTTFKSDDEESMREHVEDALEFVLRSTQDFKEPA